MLNPNCPFHRLSDEERIWIIRFLTLLWDQEKEPDVWVEFDISEQATTMRLEPFHLAFKETPSMDRSAPALSVVGIHAYIHELSKLPVHFDALVDHARTSPTIRALVLLFASLEFLQESVKPFVQVLVLAAETIELVLAYEEEEEEEEEEQEERKAVGVDLITLEPNGRIWVDLPNWRGDNNLQMLQRELKKKK